MLFSLEEDFEHVRSEVFKLLKWEVFEKSNKEKNVVWSNLMNCHLIVSVFLVGVEDYVIQNG